MERRVNDEEERIRLRELYERSKVDVDMVFDYFDITVEIIDGGIYFTQSGKLLRTEPVIMDDNGKVTISILDVAGEKITYSENVVEENELGNIQESRISFSSDNAEVADVIYEMRHSSSKFPRWKETSLFMCGPHADYVTSITTREGVASIEKYIGNTTDAITELVTVTDPFKEQYIPYFSTYVFNYISSADQPSSQLIRFNSDLGEEYRVINSKEDKCISFDDAVMRLWEFEAKPEVTNAFYEGVSFIESSYPGIIAACLEHTEVLDRLLGSFIGDNKCARKAYDSKVQ